MTATDLPDDRADVIEQAAKVIAKSAVASGNVFRFGTDDAARALSAAGLLVSPADQDNAAEDLCSKLEVSLLRPRLKRAEAEVERLHSWDGLIELLDEHWPEDIFPTDPVERRDLGPRLVALVRVRDRLRAQVEAVQKLHAEQPGDSYSPGPRCSDCWDAYNDAPKPWPCPTIRAFDTAGGGDDE